MPAPPPLLGTYTPPAVRKGDRVYCRYRRAWCRVTSWTDAPVPWPRGLPPEAGGWPTVVVTRELERAIRTESASALAHHFGAHVALAWRWRKWLRTGRAGTPGSRLAIGAASRMGAAARRAKLTMPAVRNRRKS
jgi:hypothetical protein